MNQGKKFRDEFSQGDTKKKVILILTIPLRIIYYILSFLVSFSGVILNTILILMIVCGIIAGVAYAKIMPMYEQSCEQAYEKLSNMSESDFHMLSNTVIYDKDNKKIGEIDSGSYKYVDIDKISPYIQKGYISIEDKRFMEHGGVDLQSIARAALSLITKKEITQGGSTITQQVIKNNLLSQEQTYSRKLTEVLLAPALEKKFDKADIMEFYCNSNFYGNRCYGVETACKFYFGCSAKDVTLAQAAMLCGVSNSPNKYNPIASMELAKEKQKQVLDAMLEEGYISKKEYKKALEEEIQVVGIDETTSSENYMVSYAIDCATLQLMEDEGFKFQYTFSDEKEQKKYKEKYAKAYSAKSSEIRAGGYRLYTSLNQKIQKKLQNSVSKTLSAFTEKDKKTKKYALQSAAMCIDNESQFVVAVVGGRSKNDPYNRAFLSTRQPGSTIKPLLDYGPAVDNGVINGSSLFTDKKVYWDSTDKKSYSPVNSGGGYSNRTMTVRQGLTTSKNTIAFQIFKEVGSETAISYLDKMKFNSLSYADNTAPAISLGGFTYGVTVNNMCRGYATIANDGQLSSRTCLRKVDHETEGTLYEAPEIHESEAEVFSADTAFIMKDMLQGPITEGSGTGHAAYNSGQIYAGKTGTTNSNKDAWFCGFSEYYTTAVWIGYDTPRKMPGMYGGTYPLKIWTSFMNNIHKNLEKKNFTIPQTIELRRISGGNYTDSAKEISYSENKTYYSQRPGGYDYYSQQNNDKKAQWEKDYKLQQSKDEAEKVVTEFEQYKIKKAKDAINFEKEYNNVIAIIEKIPDEYEQASYKKRATTKYNSLKKEALEKWQDAIKEYKEQEADKREKQQKIDAEDAANKAKETLKENRIKKVQWYIDTLNKRSYYTSVTKELIKDGKKALKKIKGYAEYEEIKKNFEEAVKRAEKLPVKAEEPDVPQNSGDNSNIDPGQYNEPTATPIPTATPNPVTQ